MLSIIEILFDYKIYLPEIRGLKQENELQVELDCVTNEKTIIIKFVINRHTKNINKLN